MSDPKINKCIITVDKAGKVYEYFEAQDENPIQEIEYTYPSNLDSLIKTLSDTNLSIPEDAKFSVSFNKEKKVTALTLVSEDAPEFTQMIFDSKEEADNAIYSNKYKPSYAIMPDEIKNLLDNFFNGVVCFFEGYQDLHSSFIKEIERSEPKKYPSIKSLYEDKILEKILKQ